MYYLYYYSIIIISHLFTFVNTSFINFYIKDRKHTCQKPLSLSERLISIFSNEGDLVYIPFAGSGSEIVSCINNNRNYIATELNNDYIEDIIIPRIKEIK